MKIKYFGTFGLLSLVLLLLLSSCEENDNVLFTTQDDIRLGAQVAHQVDSTNRAQGKLLERNGKNAKAYEHLDRIVNRVLNSGQVKYKDEFPWTVTILNDDKVVNAFATPGGHIYVYTGLIKFLEDEDHFAGVMAHEIAHADKRHTVKQLQVNYGVGLLLGLAIGKTPGTLRQITGQITGTLAGLRFSREAETEADNTSVDYLGSTNHYACDGAAGFFTKLNSTSGSNTQIEFLSTHPNPENRVQLIQQRAQAVGCKTATAPDTDFHGLKTSLP